MKRVNNRKERRVIYHLHALNRRFNKRYNEQSSTYRLFRRALGY